MVPQEVIPPAETLAAAPVKAPKHKHRTTGNWIYDVFVYGSTAWVGVAVVSALSAHEAIHGHAPSFNWLRSLKTTVSEGLKSKLSNGLMKNKPKETIDAFANDSAMFLMLGLGGTTLMGPLKWMEDNRQKNAACIDKIIGTTPPDPELIAKEPKQSWNSVLTGRMVSWGSSYLAYLGMGTKLTSHISKGFGEAAAKAWMTAVPHANPLKVRRWADIAAFDATFTAITASATYGISRFVARKNDKEIQKEEAEALAPPPIIAQATLPAETQDSPPSKSFTDHVPSKKEHTPTQRFTDYAQKSTSAEQCPAV